MPESFSRCRFTIQPGRWYAAEFIGDEFDGSDFGHSYSPIRVTSIQPSRSGKRRLDLSFYHANYPEGVRDKVYTLETLERGATFLLARRLNHDPVRVLLITDISWAWVQARCRIQPGDDEDVQRWLSATV